MTFTKSRVGQGDASSPRLLDVAAPLGGGARGLSDPPTAPIMRPAGGNPAS